MYIISQYWCCHYLWCGFRIGITIENSCIFSLINKGMRAVKLLHKILLFLIWGMPVPRNKETP